jgi:hypothetical protein
MHLLNKFIILTKLYSVLSLYSFMTVRQRLARGDGKLLFRNMNYKEAGLKTRNETLLSSIFQSLYISAQ